MLQEEVERRRERGRERERTGKEPEPVLKRESTNTQQDNGEIRVYSCPQEKQIEQNRGGCVCKTNVSEPVGLCVCVCLGQLSVFPRFSLGCGSHGVRA